MERMIDADVYKVSKTIQVAPAEYKERRVCVRKAQHRELVLNISRERAWSCLREIVSDVADSDCRCGYALECVCCQAELLMADWPGLRAFLEGNGTTAAARKEGV